MNEPITWEQIIENMQEFSRLSPKSKDSKTLRRLGQFYHWYYFPNDEIFVPGKFLGYPNTNLNNYQGHGHGAETRKALKPFFDKLDHNEEEFNVLYEKLKNQLAQFDKNISEKTSNGSGGIYVPKKEYSLPQFLFDISTQEEDQLEITALKEGAKYYAWVSRYERNPSLREEAIKIHGTRCVACGFNFEAFYGAHGKDFIEVHHLTPLHKTEELIVNPINDMTVLCANCHRMVHRKKDIILTIEQLKSMIRKIPGS